MKTDSRLKFDIGLSAYNKLLRTVSEFHTKAYSDPDSRTGLNKVSLPLEGWSIPNIHLEYRFPRDVRRVRCKIAGTGGFLEA
jgi:hypothetical protein